MPISNVRDEYEQVKRKLASTGLHCFFWLATDGKWYMGLEDDRIRGEYHYYGPFESFEEAHRHLSDYFANPGSYFKDSSGNELPPDSPSKYGSKKEAGVLSQLFSMLSSLASNIAGAEGEIASKAPAALGKFMEAKSQFDSVMTMFDDVKEEVEGGGVDFYASKRADINTWSFDQWFETFLDEKNLPYVSWEIEDSSGMAHMIDSDFVIEQIKTAPPGEQAQIKDMIVKIDFQNGDVNDFFRHLAESFIKMQGY